MSLKYIHCLSCGSRPHVLSRLYCGHFLLNGELSYTATPAQTSAHAVTRGSRLNHTPEEGGPRADVHHCPHTQRQTPGPDEQASEGPALPRGFRELPSPSTPRSPSRVSARAVPLDTLFPLLRFWLRCHFFLKALSRSPNEMRVRTPRIPSPSSARVPPQARKPAESHDLRHAGAHPVTIWMHK